jgi:small conductance mechanosensitive channel
MTRFLFLLFVVAPLLSLTWQVTLPETASAASASLIKPNPLTDSAPDQKTPSWPTHEDDVKTQLVLTTLIHHAGWFHDVRVTANEGVVTIEGEAETLEQLNWLAKTADRLPSVIAVLNKAKIKELPVTDLTPAYAEFHSLVNRAKRFIPLFLITVALLVGFVFLSRFIHRGIRAIWGRHIQNPFLLQTMTRITMFPIWIVFFYIVLQTMGLTNIAGTLIGGTGLVGIALGFAFKDIAENYISGILLAMKSPFTEGDMIKVGNHTGIVQNLTMRGTQIIDANGTVILIPNSIIIQSVIENSNATPYSRGTFIVGIAQTDSIRDAQALIGQTLTSVKQVEAKPAPLVIVEKLSDTTVDLEVQFWFDAKLNSRFVRSEAIASVKAALLEAGFTLPYPTREIIFDGDLKLQRHGDTPAQPVSTAPTSV